MARRLVMLKNEFLCWEHKTLSHYVDITYNFITYNTLIFVGIQMTIYLLQKTNTIPWKVAPNMDLRTMQHSFVVQIGLKRLWSNLLMLPLSQWLSVRNMYLSLKTTWYQSSVVHCFHFLDHSILFFRCISVKKGLFTGLWLRNPYFSNILFTVHLEILSRQCLIKTNAYFLDKFGVYIHLFGRKFKLAGLPLRF